MMPEVYMKSALLLAEQARDMGEIPVGAVIVKDGEIIASAHNLREKDQNALAHAEVLAIRQACETLGSWRLSECDLYVTLEPCPMCTGAIINARIPRVYYGAKDPKAGCMGSVCDLTSLPFNHRPQVIGGVMEGECSALLSSFFQRLREEIPERKTVSLRPFGENDSDVLKQYLFSRRKRENIPALIGEWNTSPQTVLAVTADGVPVGYGKILPHTSDTATLEICIFSDFRGKGYGTQGFLQLRDVAVNQGFLHLNATPRHGHAPSEKVCSGAGFVFLGVSVTPKGQTLANYLYNHRKEQ